MVLKTISPRLCFTGIPDAILTLLLLLLGSSHVLGGNRKPYTESFNPLRFTPWFSLSHTGVIKLQFYCEKYTYHFLTIAICWCHPTHWPTLRNVLRNLKRPVSECELACPPSGHVTTLVNNLHYFCWPS